MRTSLMVRCARERVFSPDESPNPNHPWDWNSYIALRIIGPSELEGFDPAERRGLDPNQTFTELRVLDP